MSYNEFKQFIQKIYAPRILFVVSEEANSLCNRNGMSFTDIIAPFCLPKDGLKIKKKIYNKKIKKFKQMKKWNSELVITKQNYQNFK